MMKMIGNNCENFRHLSQVTKDAATCDRRATDGRDARH
jgi:hypothetical protein